MICGKAADVKMKYRINKRTGDRISEIGVGSSYMFGANQGDGSLID